MTDPASLPADHVFIFLHMPKAGGSTLQRVVDRQFRGRPVFRMSGRALELQDDLTRLEALEPAERDRIACLKGHVAFGVHRFFSRAPVYLTMLRDPVERLVSHYWFTRARPEHRLHDQVVDRDLSLEDYVRMRLEAGMGNLYTRLLSGRVDWDDVMGMKQPVPPEALDEAKANVERWFPVVGITERFDESLLVLAHRLGWRRLHYFKDNVTRGKPRGERAVSERERALIGEVNALDLELYAWAAERLDRAISEVPDFARRLRRFRAVNRWFAGPARLLARFGSGR